MSEVKLSKPVRSKEDITREYSSLCTRLGHAQYNLEQIKKDIALMISAAQDLNIEAATAPSAADAVAKEVSGA
jgi:hypothetical protein